jgi:signal transduction histidine kinase
MHKDLTDARYRSYRYVRLGTKLGVSFSVLAIIISALLTFALYQTVRRQLREDIRERLRSIASIAALQVDADAHATLMEPSQEGNAAYMRIKSVLQRIRGNSPNIRFIYTWRFNDAGELVFVVDAETNPKDISHLGDIYHSDDEKELRQKLADIKGPMASEEFDTDEWGVWLSGYAPFYRSDGRMEGIVGLDIAAADVISHERQFLQVALTFFGVTIPVALVLGWLLGRTLTAPIVKLTAASERIAGGDLSYRVPLYSNDEIGTLALAFNRMTQSLQDELIARGLEIDERKRAEKKLAELNKELEMTVYKLSTANRDLEDMAHVAAHDLKTPVRAIGSLAGMMALDYADKLDAEGKRLFGLLLGRSERMNDLLDAVIEYSEIGRLVYKEEQVDINELVQRTIREIASPENIEITIEGELPVITCGEQHLVLVFKNLIGNAVRFMDKAKGQIEIACVEKNGFWRFSVADNGPGIESKYFARIFRPFQTLNTHDEVETVGIGLALVKKIADMYDGAVWVESEPGKGSTFFFALPKQRTGNNMRLQNASAGGDNC